MGNLLGSLGGLGGGNSGGSSGYGQNSGNYGKGPELQCCDPVVDPISLLTTIGGIAALSLFLRQAVIDFMVMMRRRKKRNKPDLWLSGDFNEVVDFLNDGNFFTFTKINCIFYTYYETS